MNLEEYVNNLIADLYLEGDIGAILYGGILSLVTYDEFDMSLGKSLEQRVNDSFQLIHFLVETGDFAPCRYCFTEPDRWDYEFLNYGVIELRSLVDVSLKTGGERDLALLSDFGLRKTRQGGNPPKASQRILELFKFVGAGTNTVN
jgi:hypothetical protein